MIDFIFGDAGSGKSTYIYKWITQEAESHPDRSYFLFVPEQHTLKAQRELIRYSSRNGMLNLDVLSFQLLAYRVMDELGIEKPVMLDEVSKSILIRKAVIEAADELEVYKRKINSAGFVNQIKSLISELYQYDVDIDRLKEAGRESGVPLLSAKINDVYTIYKHFRDKLTERAVIPEETAYLLLSYISASALLNDAVVVFDSYTGFTPIQIKIIEHIMTKAARVRFSVTIPREAGPYRSNNDISDLYWMSRETVSALCKAGERNSVKNA
ncbi:MAG: ATP-dependent helicase, partial [Eubacteriales bacterium]|nr:ATP-dependent helicase [Eubacteriales bacterium]